MGGVEDRRRTKMYCMHVSTPHDEYNYWVLHRCAYNKDVNQENFSF